VFSLFSGSTLWFVNKEEHLWAIVPIILFLPGGFRWPGFELFSTSALRVRLPGPAIVISKVSSVINAGDATGILWKNCGGLVVRDLVLRGSGIASNRGSGAAIINELPGNQKKDFVLVSNITTSGFGADELG
jgi:hypothetical protein